MNKSGSNGSDPTQAPLTNPDKGERWRDRLQRCISCRAIHLRNTPDPVMCSCHKPRFPTNQLKYPGSAIFPDHTRYCRTCCYIILGQWSSKTHDERCQNHDLKQLPPLEELCHTEEV